jgi:hypothetical protein
VRYGAGILAGMMIVAAGCDLFQTRDSEPPTQTISTFETPTSHDIVLRNFHYAISENNVRNYIRCFVDTLYRPYQFEPSPEEQPKFVSWTLESELRYFQNIGVSLAGVSSLTDSITLRNINPGPPATAQYFMNYTLYVPHTDARAPKLVRGSMELDLTEDSLHLWSIYRWVDKKTGPDSTWSYIKAWFNR